MSSISATRSWRSGTCGEIRDQRSGLSDFLNTTIEISRVHAQGHGGGGCPEISLSGSDVELIGEGERSRLIVSISGQATDQKF